jgi:hypothetical protein
MSPLARTVRLVLLVAGAAGFAQRSGLPAFVWSMLAGLVGVHAG